MICLRSGSNPKVHIFSRKLAIFGVSFFALVWRPAIFVKINSWSNLICDAFGRAKSNTTTTIGLLGIIFLGLGRFILLCFAF